MAWSAGRLAPLTAEGGGAGGLLQGFLRRLFQPCSEPSLCCAGEVTGFGGTRCFQVGPGESGVMESLRRVQMSVQAHR